MSVAWRGLPARCLRRPAIRRFPRCLCNATTPSEEGLFIKHFCASSTLEHQNTFSKLFESLKRLSRELQQMEVRKDELVREHGCHGFKTGK